jgi:hypothetical protein
MLVQYPSHQYIGHLDKKNKKKPSELNDSVYQKNLTDIYIIFHPIATEHTFFSATHENFPNIGWRGKP